MPLVMMTLFVGSTILSFVIYQDQKKGDPWTIPDEYKSKIMPAAAEANQGKMLWAVNCKSCHGSTGMGDGPKAASLETFPGNFQTPEFQAQSDGTIYYQSFTGRGEMPNYEKKIPAEEDRWNLVAYIRTMKGLTE